MDRRAHGAPFRAAGSGAGEERSQLPGSAAHSLRAAATYDSAPPEGGMLGRSAWLHRATSFPGLKPDAAGASAHPPAQPSCSPQLHPATLPAAIAVAAPSPSPPSEASPSTSPSGSTVSSTTPKRRYLSSSSAAAHGHARAHPPATTPRAASADSPGAGPARPRSRAYSAFLSQRRRTVFLINLVSIMERMDEQIVPALSRPLGCAFRAGPHQLGLITFARALVQAVASPLGGLAGHFFDRVTVLFLGCAIWGFFCTAFSFATTVNQGILAWAFNGVGLSLIIPNSQSLVADYYTATQRGEAFGTLMLTGAVGGMLGALFATNLGGLNPLGVPGWRLAFVAVGSVSLAIGAFTLLLAVDPTRHPATRNAAAAGRRRRRAGRTELHSAGRLPTATAAAPASANGSDNTAAAVPGGTRFGGGAGLAGGLSGGGVDVEGRWHGRTITSTITTTTDDDGSDDGEDRLDHEPRRRDPGWVKDGETQPLIRKTTATGFQAGSFGFGAGGGPPARSPPSPSPQSSLAVPEDTHLLLLEDEEEPSSRRPLLRRYTPLPASKPGAGGGGGRSALPHGPHSRYSYGHGTAAATSAIAAADCGPAGRSKRGASRSRGGSDGGLSGGGDGGYGGGEVVVAGCAVAGGGYESAAATAAAVLSRSREGRPVLTWWRMWDMITTPTFLIIILQGIVGSTPWNALVFLTLYLQLIGFSDATSSSLMALFLGGTAAGALMGGWLGDRVAERYPHHGRVALVQFSVGIGVPLAVVIMRGLPMSATPTTAVLYAAVLLLKGVLTSWAAPACNNPVFAEVVPPDMRNLVYAFDRSFEGAISALGAPLVGMAAERWFGFTGVAGGQQACEHHNAMDGTDPDLLKARALGDAMLLFMAVPWSLCAIFYTGLHWTYPRDRARALRPQMVGMLEGRGGSRARGGQGGLSYKSLYGGGGGGPAGKSDV